MNLTLSCTNILKIKGKSLILLYFETKTLNEDIKKATGYGLPMPIGKATGFKERGGDWETGRLRDEATK
jgi:hypothetical protein